MSKAMVGLLAFTAGSVLTLLASRWIISVAAAQNGEPPIAGRMVFAGGSATGTGHNTGVEIKGVIPAFPPIEKMPVFMQFLIASAKQPLDGLDCRGCTFDNVNLEYGGGAYNLEDPHFSGTTTLTLTGAAANTVGLLRLLEDIDHDIPGLPTEFQPNKPVHKEATARKPITHMTVTSPYLGHM